MKLQAIFCLILLTQTVVVSFAKEPVWLTKMKKVKLLEDSRNDIVNLFGKRVNNDRENHVWFYDFKDGRMTVIFSTGICLSTPDIIEFKGWDVPQWTVIEINFDFEKHISPKKLNINLNDFKSTPVYDSSDAYEYSNDNLGVDYIINKGKIEGITFRPKSKFNYLKCK